MNPRAFLTALFLLVAASLPSHAQTNADVIVYGSTPGGYCAAIAAAREGASVILLEPTAHVGGMNTGGLSFSDSNQMYRDKLMGLFHEWHLRIQQDYQSRGVTLPYDVNVKNQTNWSYEPHVASRVTNAMLAEAGVTVLTGRYLQSVNMTGARITHLVTSNGTFTGRVFIDGSYEGDLMAAAGVSWTIGREGRADFNESFAGKVYPKATMNINGRDGGGNPLPLITTTDAGPVDGGDGNLMTYSFRLSITTNAANKVPYPAPANYDPARFEVMRRYIQGGGAVNMVGYDQYIVPNNKADGNNSIAKQFSLGFVGALNDWHAADEAGRAAIFEAHKQYTLEFLHFLANDPVFTTQQRAAAAQWGLCADEFVDNGNWPPQLYVRESRRMQGMYFITENDIISNPSKPDPIMVSSFPIDSHDCQRVVLPDGKVVNEGTIYPVKPPGNIRGYPYHVPYRSILPLPAECDNLLVPVALSCTHVAISSLRIEATWMLIGQSAGIAAAMAADRDVTVQDLPYADLKPRLEARGQVLTLPLEFTPKPNVLLIAVDDLNDWVGRLNGHPQTVTPHIDRLADRGMLFTNAHCQGTLCNPSRISFLWGRRPSSTGFYDNNYPVTNEPGFLSTHVSLPAHFAASGYKTMTAGKVFHPGTPAQSQITGPEPGYWRNGFDQPIHRDPQWHSIWDFGPQTYAETEFVDHLVASWAVDRLGENHASPFFLAAGFYRPHVPFFPPSSVYDDFSNVQLPPVKLDDWDDLPAAAAQLTLSNPKIPTHEWMLQENRWNEAVHAYLACIKWTDQQVGRLLDALDAGPNADNTIIILFSDHGYHLGEKQRWSKFSLWERTTRIPLIISVPEGLVGASGMPVELLSIYPTLIDLCGLPPNPKLEGVSVKPLLENPTAPWDHVAISTLGRNNHAVRDERWRYIRYADGSEELYDHQNDPNEWDNLAAGALDPTQTAAIAHLSSRLPTTNVAQVGEELMEGILLDDPDAELVGTWGSSTNITPYVGAGYRFTGAAGAPNDGSAMATFRFTAQEAGSYQLKMAYSPDPSRATNVPLSVTSGPHVTNFSVDQTVARPAGSVVREIGMVQLVADQESVITIGTAGTTGFVILDAIQLVPDTSTSSLNWSSPGASVITPDSAIISASLLGEGAEVTLFWKAGGSAPQQQTGWDGSLADPGVNVSPGLVERTVTGLQADTLYSSIFYANNPTIPAEAWSDPLTFASALTAAQAPVITSVTASGGTIILIWQDNAATETGYTVQRATAPDGPYVTIASLGANTTSFVDSTVSGGETYYYQIAAIHSGNGSSTDFSAAQTSATAGTPPIIVNGGFETGDFTGWTSGTGSSVSSATPLGGTYSAVQTLSGAQQLSQSFTTITGPATTTFLFSASDPGGASDRSFNPTFRGSGFVSGSPQINLRVVDLNNNGVGDVQVFSGIAGSGGTWQTVLTHAVTFDSTTSFSLTINGYDTNFSYDLTVGSQSATGLSLVQNGPLSDFAQLSFVNSSMAAGSTVKIDNVAVVIPDAAPFRLKITLNTGNPGHYDFTWHSQLWKTYSLVSSTDLSTRPDFWPVWDGRTDIAGTGFPITLSNVPAGGDSKRFFAISENN